MQVFFTCLFFKKPTRCLENVGAKGTKYNKTSHMYKLLSSSEVLLCLVGSQQRTNRFGQAQHQTVWFNAHRFNLINYETTEAKKKKKSGKRRFVFIIIHTR